MSWFPQWCCACSAKTHQLLHGRQQACLSSSGAQMWTATSHSGLHVCAVASGAVMTTLLRAVGVAWTLCAPLVDSHRWRTASRIACAEQRLSSGRRSHRVAHQPRVELMIVQPRVPTLVRSATDCSATITWALAAGSVGRRRCVEHADGNQTVTGVLSTHRHKMSRECGFLGSVQFHRMLWMLQRSGRQRCHVRLRTVTGMQLDNALSSGGVCQQPRYGVVS